MSESSSKRGPKRRLTDSERKRWKRESNAKLGKNRIWTGDQCDHWDEPRSVLREREHAQRSGRKISISDEERRTIQIFYQEYAKHN